MARGKRHHFPGMCYHVMLRGNEKRDIFFDDADRRIMLFLLQEGVERHGHRIHSYCFMRNHIHLLIQVGEISTSKIIHHLASGYSQKINRKYERVGHLFQGRYKAILIEEERYFIRLVRYIHLNPVRANIVNQPSEYFWSSHNSYMEQNKIGWLTIDYALSKFGQTREKALESYSSYVSEVESSEELDELRTDFKEGYVLGSDDFLEKVLAACFLKSKKVSPLIIIANITCDFLKVDNELLASSSQIKSVCFARGVIALISKVKYKLSIEEIASFMNRKASTISNLISRFMSDFGSLHETQNIVALVTQRVEQLAQI